MFFLESTNSVLILQSFETGRKVLNRNSDGFDGYFLFSGDSLYLELLNVDLSQCFGCISSVREIICLHPFPSHL